jgi:hypothetical protein
MAVENEGEKKGENGVEMGGEKVDLPVVMMTIVPARHLTPRLSRARI